MIVNGPKFPIGKVTLLIKNGIFLNIDKKNETAVIYSKLVNRNNIKTEINVLGFNLNNTFTTFAFDNVVIDYPISRGENYMFSIIEFKNQILIKLFFSIENKENWCDDNYTVIIKTSKINGYNFFKKSKIKKFINEIFKR